MEFNTIIYNFNEKRFESYDIIPYLLDEYKNSSEKLEYFADFKNFILNKSANLWWGRCEYEIILSNWPGENHKEKWDIYSQIKLNIDIITNIFINEIKNN